MHYGIGFSRGLPAFLSEKGFNNVVFLVDEGVAKHSPYYSGIKTIVENSVNTLHVEILRGTEEPDYDYLDVVAERVRAIPNVDVLVGIGGGSCLDITKAVGVLRTNKGRGIDYRGFDKVVNPGVPVIAIPTTAGTGSEVTINAVFTDKKEMKKLGINGRYLNATYAVLDAEWTMSCPLPAAVSSGIDALTHALESFMCRKATPLTRVFSTEAVRLLCLALPALVDDPANKEKRQQMLLGSYLAGIALFNSGSGISGALSYPIGVHFKVPHGIGGGVFLSSVVGFNIERGYFEFARLMDVIEQCPGLSDKEKSERFLALLKNLTAKLGVPEYLDQWGITKDNVEETARLMLPLQAAFDQNPVSFSAEKDAAEMLNRHVSH